MGRAARVALQVPGFSSVRRPWKSLELPSDNRATQGGPMIISE